jgi:hypothetical protein
VDQALPSPTDSAKPAAIFFKIAMFGTAGAAAMLIIAYVAMLNLSLRATKERS